MFMLIFFEIGGTFTKIVIVVCITVIVHTMLATAAIACTAIAASSAATSSIVAVTESITTTKKMSAKMPKAVGIKTGTCYLINPFYCNRPIVKQGFSYAAPSFAYGYQNKACSCTL